MFSSITIASSMTNPTEIVSAISDRLLRLKPATYISANVATIEIGTTALAISVARRLRRKRKTTAVTSVMVSTRWNCTSSTEARMVRIRSLNTSSLIAGGMAA